MPAPLAIETIGLTKRYGDVTAVADLSLSIERGEVFGFLGPNGAGKTTTVKLILGLVRPSAGEVRVLGQSMPSQSKQILQRVGATVEAPAFYPYLSGRENLVLLAKMSRIPERDVDQSLARVSLTEAAGRLFETYSMGMKQRLAIAAALLRKPDLILLDEPTTGLDPAGQREIRDLLPQLARDGCAVFISSHAMHEVEEICDRVGILRDGRLLRTAPVRDLVQSESVVEIVVDEPTRGLEILKEIDWVTEAEALEGRLIVRAASGRAADLNQALAMRGIFASEIRPRARSLEDVYFEAVEHRAA